MRLMTSVLDVTPVVGLPQHHGWSQLFQSSDKNVVVVFAIGGSDAHNVGKDVVETLQSRVESGRRLTAPEFYELLLKIQAEVADKDAALSLAAVLRLHQGGESSESDQLLLAAFEAAVWLKRDAKTGLVIEAERQLKVVQGELQSEDCLVLATRQAFNMMGEVKQKLQQGYEVESIITSLVPGLHGQEDSAQSALGFLEVVAQETSSLVTEPVVTWPSLDEEPFDEAPVTEADAIETGSETESDATLNVLLPPEAATMAQLASESSKAQQTASKGTVDLKSSAVAAISSIKGQSRLAVGVLRGAVAAAGRLQPGSRGVYVGSAQRRRTARAIIVTVLIAVAALGLGAWSWRRAEARRHQLESQLAPLAQSFAQVQQQIESDPISARQQTEQLLQELTQAKSSFESQKLNTKQLDELKTQVQQFYDQHSGREEFSQLPTFFDLRTIDTEFITTALTYDSENQVAYFIDAERARVIRFELDTKQQRLWDVSRLEPSVGRLVDLKLRTASKLILLSDQGLFELDTTSAVDQPSVTRLRSSEEQLQAASQVETFGDFIYVLNNSKNAIYRYVPADQGYADPVTWSTQGGLPIEDATSMAIDGDVWLANVSGEIAKMRSGRTEDFVTRGLPSALQGKLALFTTAAEDSDLFVLESDQHRIIRLNKSGEFVQEVSSGTLASATQVFVDQSAGIAYVVSGAEIFEAKLDASE